MDADVSQQVIENGDVFAMIELLDLEGSRLGGLRLDPPEVVHRRREARR
jgi:hypothetical protein